MTPQNPNAKETILAIPDMHHPFAHKDTLAFLKAIKDKFKPTEVVCLGDEIDAHALSEYDHDPDGMSAGDELNKAIEALKPVFKLFPKVKVCTSNHTARPFRKAVKAGLPRQLIKEYKDFLDAPKGWEWRDQWEVDGILFEHGEGVGGKNAALDAASRNMQSTVIGHVHTGAGVQYAANPKALYFGLNAGCLIDKEAYAFGYGKHIKSKPILGVGVIVKGIPMFVPMLLNSKGRWIGKL